MTEHPAPELILRDQIAHLVKEGGFLSMEAAVCVANTILALPALAAIEAHDSALLARAMTLRDWFAGQAIPTVLAFVSAPEQMRDRIAADLLPEERVARITYAIADAMLAARITGEQP